MTFFAWVKNHFKRFPLNLIKLWDEARVASPGWSVWFQTGINIRINYSIGKIQLHNQDPASLKIFYLPPILLHVHETVLVIKNPPGLFFSKFKTCVSYQTIIQEFNLKLHLYNNQRNLMREAKQTLDLHHILGNIYPKHHRIQYPSFGNNHDLKSQICDLFLVIHPSHNIIHFKFRP